MATGEHSRVILHQRSNADCYTRFLRKKLTSILQVIMVLVMCSMTALGQIPDELAKLADKAIELADRDNCVPQFDQLMTELGNKTDAQIYKALLPLEGQSLQAKMIVMAYYRVQNQDLYENIMDVFFRFSNKAPGIDSVGGARSPEVTKEYLSEGYRLIWEYQLLSLDRWREMHNQSLRPLGFARVRPIEAIGRIRNEKSLQVTRLAYQRIIGPTFDIKSMAGLLEAIINIGSVKSNDSNKAFAEFMVCYTSSEPYAKEYEKMAQRRNFVESQKSMTAFFLLMISSEDKELQYRWQNAARDYPRAGLSAREINFLQKIIDSK